MGTDSLSRLYVIAALVYVNSLTYTSGQVQFASNARLRPEASAPVTMSAGRTTPVQLSQALSAATGRGFVLQTPEGLRVEADRGSRLSEAALLASLSLSGYDVHTHENLYWILTTSPGAASAPPNASLSPALPTLPGKSSVSLPAQAGSVPPWLSDDTSRLTVWVLNESAARSDRKRILARFEKIEGTPGTASGTGMKKLLAGLGGYWGVLSVPEALGLKVAVDWLSTDTDGKIVQRYETLMTGAGSVKFTRAQDVRFLAGSISTPASGTVVTERAVDSVTAGLTVNLGRRPVGPNEDELAVHITVSDLRGFDANGLPQTSRTEGNNIARVKRGDFVRILSFSGTSEQVGREKFLGLVPARNASYSKDSYAVFVEVSR